MEAQQTIDRKDTNVIFIGKKPTMAYVTALLVRLANESSVIIKARGLSMIRAVDVSQIIVKRMDTLGYKIEGVTLGSEEMQSQDGRKRNVSTIEIKVTRTT